MLFLFVFGIITCVFILKQLFASGSVIIGEHSPRLRLGEYSPITTSPSANNCQLVLKLVRMQKKSFRSSPVWARKEFFVCRCHHGVFVFPSPKGIQTGPIPDDPGEESLEFYL